MADTQHSPSNASEGHLGAQLLEMRAWQCFGESISEVLFRGTIFEMEGAVFDEFTDIMVLKVNVFRASVKLVVRC